METLQEPGCSKGTYARSPSEPSPVRVMLAKIARSWHSRAQVRRATPTDDLLFEAARPDFPIELLPFRAHPRFEAFSDLEKSRTLTAAWFVYSAKTIEIETHIVNPFCCDVLQDRIPGLRDGTCREIISETMVDESYHVLMTANADRITEVGRGIEVDVPTSSLTRMMMNQRELYPGDWRATLVQFATALVSEVFVSDYLKLLSCDRTIQPLHRAVVDAHRRDESVHNTIFRQFARLVYTELDVREREFFSEIMPKPVRWFAEYDFDMWTSIFAQLGIANVGDLVGDCKAQQRGSLGSIDYSGIVELANELGVTDLAVGRRAFEDEGLAGEP